VQTYIRVGRRTQRLEDIRSCLLVRTYARVGGRILLSFSADIHGGTTERTLTNSTSYSMNSTWTYASKYQMYATFWIDHWTYEEMFGLLVNSMQT
jgi:hypothetical protein